MDKPWSRGPGDDSDAKFDVHKPRLGALPATMLSRFEIFKNSFISKHLVAAIMSDMSEEQQRKKLLDIVSTLAELCAGEDIVELDGRSATVVRECSTAALGLTFLLTWSWNPSYMEAVTSIHERRNMTDRSILTMVASAIVRNPSLKSRLETAIRIYATITEHGPRVEQYLRSMSDMPGGPDDLQTIESMAATLGTLQAAELPEDMITGFSDGLHALVLKSWGCLKPLLQSGDGAAGLVRRVDTCFASAFLVFSMDKSIEDIRGEIAELIRSGDAAVRFRSISKALNDMVPMEDDAALADVLQAASFRLDAARGMQPTAELKDNLMAGLDKAVNVVEKRAFDEPEANSVKNGLALVATMVTTTTN